MFILSALKSTSCLDVCLFVSPPSSDKKRKFEGGYQKEDSQGKKIKKNKSKFEKKGKFGKKV